MRDKEITVIINTFKSEDKIYNCLNSIPQQTFIIVIENSNNTNFKKSLESKYSNVTCILAGENLGYAKGNNLGLSKVKSRYALILNPDTLLEKNTLSNFLSSAEKIKDFSILGPAKQEEQAEIDLNPNERNIFEVNSLKGFAMFFNMKEFKDIGFLTRIFLFI